MLGPWSELANAMLLLASLSSRAGLGEGSVGGLKCLYHCTKREQAHDSKDPALLNYWHYWAATTTFQEAEDE